MYKAGGTRLVIKINELFETIWSAERILQEFKDASIVHLYKRKGECEMVSGSMYLTVNNTVVNEHAHLRSHSFRDVFDVH